MYLLALSGTLHTCTCLRWAALYTDVPACAEQHFTDMYLLALSSTLQTCTCLCWAALYITAPAWAEQHSAYTYLLVLSGTPVLALLLGQGLGRGLQLGLGVRQLLSQDAHLPVHSLQSADHHRLLLQLPLQLLAFRLWTRREVCCVICKGRLSLQTKL